MSRSDEVDRGLWSSVRPDSSRMWGCEEVSPQCSARDRLWRECEPCDEAGLEPLGSRNAAEPGLDAP